MCERVCVSVCVCVCECVCVQVRVQYDLHQNNNTHTYKCNLNEMVTFAQKQEAANKKPYFKRQGARRSHHTHTHKHTHTHVHTHTYTYTHTKTHNLHEIIEIAFAQKPSASKVVPSQCNPFPQQPISVDLHR